MKEDSRLLDALKAWPQYVMPGHLLSLGMHSLARVKSPTIKDLFIDWFVNRFKIDMSQAAEPDPHAYPDFNSFFTRALKEGVRPIAEGPGEVACPVDGTVSQAGDVADGRIFQAKGHDYSLVQLLGGSEKRAEPFMGGRFTTIYLSPRDYHRIHMPFDGTLKSMVHVPGRLFSVSPATTRMVPGLFARNERVVTLFDTAMGPMAVILVGAVFVGGIETVWSGLVTPPAGRVVRSWNYKGEEAITLRKGEELGRFNMGSTIVLLFGPEAVEWSEQLQPEETVVMGQKIARTA